MVAVSSVPPLLTAAPSPGGLWYALGRRWLLALTLALLGAGLLGAALWQLVPAPYSSQLKLHLQKPPSYMPGADGVTLDDYLRSQAVLLRSPRLLQAVLANGRVKELASVPQDPAEAEEWLAKNLSMKLAVGENYLPLKFSCSDPHEAAILLKVLVEEYRKELLRAARSSFTPGTLAGAEQQGPQGVGLPRQLRSQGPGGCSRQPAQIPVRVEPGSERSGGQRGRRRRQPIRKSPTRLPTRSRRTWIMPL